MTNSTLEESIKKYRLIGLHLGVRGGFHEDEYVNYNLGIIAHCALTALQTAVLAIEQIVTGEKLINSLDVGDFYNNLSEALATENGQGVLSESGDMPGIQSEIEDLIKLVGEARRIAKRPRGQ